MKHFFTVLFSTIILLACNNKKYNRPPETFYMPAEWEAHDAIWLGWEKDSVRGYYPAIAATIKVLAPNVIVKIAFHNDTIRQKAISYLLSQGVNSSMYKTYIMPGERYWIRDHGAAFLVNGKGELGVADFAWNGYGYSGFCNRNMKAI